MTDAQLVGIQYDLEQTRKATVAKPIVAEKNVQYEDVTDELVNHPEFIKDAQKQKKELLKNPSKFINISKKYLHLLEP